MVKVVQVIKKLNNTELGKGGTHDTYVLIPQNLDISDLFPIVNEQISFINKENGKIVNLRHTSGREKRIVGLGPYYNEYDVCAGDEIILERQIIRDESQYFISLKKRLNTIMLQKQRNGFEILTDNRTALLESVTLNGVPLQLKYLCSEKKRQDSPEPTDFYDLLAGERSLLGDYSGKEFVEVEVNNNAARLNRFCAWKKYIFDMEDENE